LKYTNFIIIESNSKPFGQYKRSIFFERSSKSKSTSIKWE